MFEDWLAINALLMTYAECIDGGQFAEGAKLFEHATYRVADKTYRGAAEVESFFVQTRLYPDGTPRTKHVITNVNIELDGDRASSRCYATVFQQTDVLPLQPIASGRYIDQYERVGGEWRFSDHLITGFLLGDRSQHVAWHEGAPT